MSAIKAPKRDSVQSTNSANVLVKAPLAYPLSLEKSSRYMILVSVKQFQRQRFHLLTGSHLPGCMNFSRSMWHIQSAVLFPDDSLMVRELTRSLDR